MNYKYAKKLLLNFILSIKSLSGFSKAISGLFPCSYSSHIARYVSQKDRENPRISSLENCRNKFKTASKINTSNCMKAIILTRLAISIISTQN